VAGDYHQLCSETQKKDMLWNLLKRVHEENAFDWIDNIFKTMTNSMEVELDEAIIEEGELTEHDVILGKKSAKCFGMRTEDMFNQHDDQRGLQNDMATLKDMYFILKAEGYRFLDTDESRACWRQVNIKEGIDFMSRRMKYLYVENEKKRKAEDLSSLDKKRKAEDMSLPIQPGPLAVEEPSEETLDDSMIVLGTSNIERMAKKGRASQAVYHQAITKNIDDYRNASNEKKGMVAAKVIDSLLEKGFQFMKYDEETRWMSMERVDALKLVRRALRNAVSNESHRRVVKPVKPSKRTKKEKVDNIEEGANDSETNVVDNENTNVSDNKSSDAPDANDLGLETNPVDEDTRVSDNKLIAATDAPEANDFDRLCVVHDDAPDNSVILRNRDEEIIVENANLTTRAGAKAKERTRRQTRNQKTKAGDHEESIVKSNKKRK
jgi:hypothetical protein